MTMKKMKNFMALLLALVMTMSLVACGNKASEETKTGEEIGCYVQTTETGEKVLVDKDGKAVTDFTLDADGNVLDADGNVVVKAEDITAYVEQSGNVTDEKAEEPKVDDAQKTEDKTDAKDEVKADDKKTETKVDESKKDESKKDETKKDETKKDDAKQETQKPADNKQDTAKPETKPETKPEVKPEPQKPAAPSYDNGSLTTAQVKELQRWYGVGADGQWGAGSKKAAGGRTADEAWAYYQNNKQTTTPDKPSGGNGGSTTPSKPSDDNSGSTGGGSTTPTEPTKPTKADIDCSAAMAAGNAYAESVGFEIWDGSRSYFPPIYLERDCPESCWNQEWVESAIKQKVDYVKETAIRLGRWSPVDEVPEGCASAVNCVVRWNASAGYHEIFVYYAA